MPVYARVTVVEADANRVEEGVRSFNELVLPAAQGVEGYRGALLLVDRQKGTGIGLTLWESKEARERGAAALDEVRAQTIQAMGGGTPPPVDHYDVASADLP